MQRWWWLGLAAVLIGPAPGVRGVPESPGVRGVPERAGVRGVPEKPACVDLPCQVCFVVAEAVGRAGGEPISCAAGDPPVQLG